MNRIKNIDILKGVLMILVVIGHFYFLGYNSRTLTLIYSFHMPCFLIIGGYLLNINYKLRVSENILKRFMHTIIPYLIFNIIAIILISPADMRLTYFTHIFLGVGDPNYAINLPTWFLTFYFLIISIYEIILYISNKCIKNKWTSHILVIISIFIGYILWVYTRKIWLPFNIQQSFFCIGFVHIGYILKQIIGNDVSDSKKTKKSTKNVKYVSKNNKKNNNKIKYLINYIQNNNILLIFIIILITIIWYKLSMYNGRIDINAKDYKNKFIFYISAIFGSIIIYYISIILSKIYIIKDILSYIGKNSIYVLGYHIISFSIINMLVTIFFPNMLPYLNNFNIISTIFYVILEISIALIFGYIHKSIKNGR